MTDCKTCGQYREELRAALVEAKILQAAQVAGKAALHMVGLGPKEQVDGKLGGQDRGEG